MKLFKKEYNLRDLWNSVKHHNVQIIGVTKEEDKKKEVHEKILEEIIAENFPKTWKEKNHRSPRSPEGAKQINPRQTPQDTY